MPVVLQEEAVPLVLLELELLELVLVLLELVLACRVSDRDVAF